MLQFVKALVYLFLFLQLAQSNGFFTKGFNMDHPISMILTAFAIFFFVELFFNLVEKKLKSQEDSKKEKKKDKSQELGQEEITFNKILEDVLKEINKTWQFSYKNMNIKIVNKYNQEQLFINDLLVDEKKRKSSLGYLNPYQKLNGVIESNGEKYIVKVIIGGIFNLKCKVYINKKLVYKDKIKINIKFGE